MTTLILIIHLTLAAAYVIATAILLIGAIMQKLMSSVFISVLSTFGGIIISGTALVAVSPKSITQFCVSALISSVCGAIVVALYRRRVTTVQAA